MDKEQFYFKNAEEWRAWLHQNHADSKGVYLIFYRVDSDMESMRWEEAVKVALCYGWIDSTVRKVDDEQRKQLFSPRKDKSVWSKLNKTYIEQLIAENLMHESGLKKIQTARDNGSWNALDHVEELTIPEDLKAGFDKNETAYKNFLQFSKTYRKGYLYWLNQAKLSATRQKRISEIIRLCEQNLKSRF